MDDKGAGSWLGPAFSLFFVKTQTNGCPYPRADRFF
jgi:hypothetical protein